MSFILLALSGLAFFHPAFYPLSLLLGGGVWARILHPFIGVLMALLFVSMFFRFRKLNIITPVDKEWLSRIGEMVDGDDHNMPQSGKYNGGQKLLFWLLAACMVLLVLVRHRDLARLLLRAVSDRPDPPCHRSCMQPRRH